MTDQMTQLREKIAATELEQLEKWRPHARATHTTRELFKNYEDAANRAKAAAQSAAQLAKTLQADDVIKPEIRRQRVAEAIANGKAEVKTHQDRMDAALSALKAELSTASVPRVDPVREMPARDELRMVLDGSPDPVATMFEIAQRDDELAAVAASSYGESYLRARGVPKAKEAHGSIRGVAAASAASSADPMRRAIGEAYAEIGTLEGSLACTVSITRTALEAGEEAGAGR